MKIAFVAQKVFDCRAGNALCAVWREMGHDAVVSLPEGRTVDTLRGYDVVMEVGRARDADIPEEAVHIAWVQECYGATDPDYNDVLGQDILYTYGDPSIIGCPPYRQWRGSLTWAVDHRLLDRQLVEPSLDFSIVGFIPPPDWFKFPSKVPANPGRGDFFNISSEATDFIVQTMKIRALSGTFDQNRESECAQRGFAEVMRRRGWYTSAAGWREIRGYIGQTVHEYARLLDRKALTELALSVSRNIEIWGTNWELWPEFAPYSRLFCFDNDVVLDLYQRSRINLHNNIFGFALHSRVLEAMAVGGFVMANESPHVGKKGQLTETFEPDVHYGEYNADNFIDRASSWLYSETRPKLIRDARKVIAARHLWKHRAEQVLADLATA